METVPPRADMERVIRHIATAKTIGELKARRPLVDRDEQAAWIRVGVAAGNSMAHGLAACDDLATPELTRLRQEWQRFETYLITEDLWQRGR